MNDNARAWIEALRSGKYKQGLGQLSTGLEFCCLGVACDLYAKVNDMTVTSSVERVSYDDSDSVLPESVQEWLGLKDDGGAFDEGALYRMNDDGVTFTEIATLIESEPPGLFV